MDSWLIKIDADLIRQVIIQASVFLVFFVVVKVFFADKIKEILKKRSEAIEQELDEAAKTNQDAKELEARLYFLLNYINMLHLNSLN